MVPRHTSTMELGEWLSQNAVTIVLGLAAIIASVWAARRWGTRHPRLVVTAETFSLMRSHEDGLEVTYKGHAVEHPHVTRVTLECRGPADISPAHFETGNSIYLRLSGAEILAITSSDLKHTITEAPHGTTSPDDGETKTSVELLPQHLAVKKPRTISMVTDGEPGQGQLVGALLNVRITNKAPDGWGAVQVGAVCGGLGVLTAVLALTGGAPRWLALVPAMFFAFGVTWVMTGVFIHEARRVGRENVGPRGVMLRSK